MITYENNNQWSKKSLTQKKIKNEKKNGVSSSSIHKNLDAARIKDNMSGSWWTHLCLVMH